MSPISTSIGRPNNQRDFSIQDVVVHLLTGRNSPTHSEIEQNYGLGAKTVQNALDRLRQDGFMQSRGANSSQSPLGRDGIGAFLDSLSGRGKLFLSTPKFQHNSKTRLEVPAGHFEPPISKPPTE